MENKSKFNDYLRFQISQKYKLEHVERKIPKFNAQLEDSNEKILQMIDSFENMKHRDVYSLLVQEFNKLIDK